MSQLVRYFMKNMSTVTGSSSHPSVKESLELARNNIALAHQKYCQTIIKRETRKPCVIAVSKTKPFELIAEAYACDQRHFGENYVQELIQKATQFKESGNYEDIKWHFIGSLQRNKVNNLLAIPNLECVQTVSSIKLADALNNSLSKRGDDNKLKVYVQINSSNEDSKSGCPPDQCLEIVQHVLTKNPCLQFEGLMTIGSLSYDYSKGPNPDFECMLQCRQRVCDELNLNVDDVQLSMGMSNDYQQAILSGSTTVRMGSTIFGARENRPST